MTIRIVLAAIIGITILASIGFFFIHEAPPAAPANVESANPAPTLLPPRTPPEGQLEYRNEMYRISLFYPQDLQVEEAPGEGGTMTIIFEDDLGKEGFQIFVTPYNRDEITEERMALDIPSGVFLEPLDVMIDGTRATMFFSTNARLGDTREVWFIRNNFLYEVVTYRALDAWLSQIMATWRFLI